MEIESMLNFSATSTRGRGRDMANINKYRELVKSKHYREVAKRNCKGAVAQIGLFDAI